MKYEVWVDYDPELACSSAACFPTDNSEGVRKTLSPHAELLHEFEASDWNEAMTKYHELMRFEPYIPMED